LRRWLPGGVESSRKIKSCFLEAFPLDNLDTIASLGLSLPSPAYLFGAILFGLIGFGAYRYGKKASHPQAKWIGVALMLFPYVVSETWLLYVMGAGLCAGLYWLRE
jgi:hypothetical protein